MMRHESVGGAEVGPNITFCVIGGHMSQCTDVDKFLLSGSPMAKVHEIGSSSIKKCLLLGISTRFS